MRNEVMACVLLFMALAGSCEPSEPERSRSDFVELCLRAVEQPSQNALPLIESEYYEMSNGLTDTLSDQDYRQMGVLLSALTGAENLPGRDYERYAGAAYSTLYGLLNQLDTSGKLHPGLQSASWDVNAWREWFSRNVEEIRRLESAGRYRRVVQKLKEAMK